MSTKKTLLRGSKKKDGLSSENITDRSNLEEPISKNNSKGKKLCHFNFSPFLVFPYTFTCSVFLILSSVFVKQLDYIDPSQLSLVRNAGTFAWGLPICIFSTESILGPRRHWLTLWLRSFFVATALYLNLLAYRILPMADASIIMAAMPAVVAVMAHFYLKERCSWVEFFAILLTLIGVCLAIRLPEILKEDEARYDITYYKGLGCALGCVMLMPFNIITVRIMTDVHFSVMNLYFGVLGAIENLILTETLSSFSLPHCGGDVIKVMLIGVFGFVGQCFLILAIQVETAGVSTTLKVSCDIIVAMIFQVMFFDDALDWYSAGGASAVIVSVCIIGIKKWLQTLPEDSNRRKQFSYFLL